MALTKIGSSGLDTNAITSDKITADSITEAKIADAAVENEHLNTNIITAQTELSETVATDDVILIYDTSTNTLKKVSTLNMQLGAPTITSISPTNVDSKDSATTTTFTVTGTNFYTGTTAKLKNNSGSDINFNTVTRDSNTQLTCVLNNGLITGDGITDEPYDISVTSPLGTGTLENQINVDQRPVFVTASGSLGTQRSGSFTATVQATDPESAGAIRYDVVGGTLPTGITLNTSTGVVSGSITPESSDTTYNFTIQASDVDSNVSFRDFSITLSGPITESFTSSGTFSVPSGITTVDVLVVAGGGTGVRGGGGAGGLIFRPGFPVTPGGTVSVTVGNGGTYNSDSNSPTYGPDNTGQDSVFGTLTAKGGGHGGRQGPAGAAYFNGGPGGSGGGTGGTGGNEGPLVGPGGSATQPTQPGDSGTYGFGNPGGIGSANPWPANPDGGGGGGGAGASGQPAASGGSGGIGRAYTIADGTTPVYYAGGSKGLNTPGATDGQGTGSANKGGGSAGGNPGGQQGFKGVVLVRY